jgi:hypothetical protein
VGFLFWKIKKSAFIELNWQQKGKVEKISI